MNHGGYMWAKIKKTIVSTVFLGGLLYAEVPDSLSNELIELENVLEVWVMPNGADPEATTLELLQQFTEKTGVKTRLVILNWENAWAQISEALQRGIGPSIVQLGSTWLPYFAEKDLLMSLSPYRDEFLLSRFPDPVAQSTKVGEGNVHYGVPWFLDVRLLLANKKYFDESGLTPDDVKTWSAFQATLSKINERKIKNSMGILVDGFGFSGKGDWNVVHNFAPWVWSEGGAFLKNQEGRWRSGLLDPETARGIRRYVGMALEGYASRAALKMNTNLLAQRFINGEQVFLVGTTELIMKSRLPVSQGGVFESALGQDELYVFPIPSGSAGSVSFLGGSHLAIPKYASTDTNAIELLKHLTSPENIHSNALKIGFLPTDKKVLTGWSWDPLYNTVVQEVKNGRSYPNIGQWGNIEAILVEMFGAVWTLVDNPEIFSEKELYNILSLYDALLNRMLSVEARSPHPSFRTYVSYLDEDVKNSDRVKNELSNEGISRTVWAIVISILVLVLVLIFLRNQYKEQEEEEEIDKTLHPD
jgi:multiple sugar transport system substrate-binding protein